MIFESKFKKLGHCVVPEKTGVRVMMMPIIIGDSDSIPLSLSELDETLETLFQMTDHQGKTGYITIDAKRVKAGETHRRAGLHVDGVFHGECGSWGGGGGWGSVGNGMITVSSVPGCRAWAKTFDGEIGMDGECDSLASQATNEDAVLFEANRAYWVDGLCVHESVPVKEETDRTFIRLSLPSKAAWFEGYTVNPRGVLPTGPILPRREFMQE